MSEVAAPPFAMLAMSPGGLEHPALAVAAARAGHTGILDLSYCTGPSFEQGAANTQRLLGMTSAEKEIGLRLGVEQLEAAQPLLVAMAGRRHTVILRGSSEELSAACVPLRAAQRRLLAEVVDDQGLEALAQVGVEGVVACGYECGGWVGESSAFVLLQRLLKRGLLPVYARGIVGAGSLAACRVAGAAGALLDDQLLMMPESPLPTAWRYLLHNVDGQETVVLGGALGAPCRVLQQPSVQRVRMLQEKARSIEVEGGASLRERWRTEAAPLIGWGPPQQVAWPVGQSVSVAAAFLARYSTTAGLLQALMEESTERLREAQRLRPLAEGSPLARSHQTRFPIVQGPMTRVSDTPRFAEAVARNGGLPLLALALMRGEQARQVLNQTRELLAGKPWGVGILGFVPPEIREEQTREMVRIKPPFALIAGGRPDHAQPLEREGIRTYLHVPSPGLLRIFLEQGARCFVFEGRESGGHVGPLGSFTLWELMVDTLLREVPREAEAQVHVLFAGGIHDARSAAMVAALAAPLSARGMQVGVLMGTAYMFTAEAVETGAIVPAFQQQLLACTRTITLESGVGHANRCAVTPFTEHFLSLRRQLLAEGRSADQVKATLEDLALGRLRVATKAMVRNGTGELLPVSEEQQLRDGMFMAGEVAALHSSVSSMEALHREVAEQSTQLLERALVEEPAAAATLHSQPCDVAVIGLSTLLPGAQDPEGFWSNLLRNAESVTEIPRSRWDWRLLFDPDRKAPDRSYSRWGGFFEDLVIDPVQFGIPPNSMKHISPAQVLMLELVRRSLADAGYATRGFDRNNTAVIVGASDAGGLLHHQHVVRTLLPFYVGQAPASIQDRLGEWSEESFSGTLTNVAAGRVANRFDLGGPNYTVDAACASSLTALELGVRELQSGRSNMSIVGGIDVGQHPYAYIAFSKTQALSPSGHTRSFDQSADGIVISEGLVVMVLKRLADAERDGDRIYAVIKGMGASSDGKAMGMTAPRPLGQQRALARAYRQAGFSPNTLGFYEAHATGTAVGDRSEVEAFVGTMKAENAPPKSCAVGSVKSLIGHTKTAAGLVGIAKAALALHYQVLPPQAGVEQPLEGITDPQSPIYLLREARPWLASPAHPRRCGVSAFGFGGTNSHAVLEEYTGRVAEQAPGADRWPWELLVFSGRERTVLADKLRSLRDALKDGAVPQLGALAYSLALRRRGEERFQACILADGLGPLRDKLEAALAHLEGRSREPLPAGAWVTAEEARAHGRVAFLFPGQGSQHIGMAREPALYFRELRSAFERADRLLRGRLGASLSEFVFPPASYTEPERRQAEKRLKNTHVAQPAIGAVSLGYSQLLTRLGMKPELLAGHSYGEYSALHAAGAFSQDDLLLLSEARGRAMASSSGQDGAMAAMLAPHAAVKEELRHFEGVVVAAFNTPEQVVISGEARAVRTALEAMRAKGLSGSLLPVSGAFHSSLMQGAQAPLSEALTQVSLRCPQLPVYAGATGRPHSQEASSIREMLEAQLLAPVRFVEVIQNMYEDGARIFVEMGPGDLSTRMVRQILGARPHLAVALEPRGGGLQGVLSTLAELIAQGVSIELPELFRGRRLKVLEIDRLLETTSIPPPAPTAWRINGTYSWPHNQPSGRWGKVPALDADSPQPVPPPAPVALPPATPVAAPAAARARVAEPPAMTAGAPGGHWPEEAVLSAYRSYQETMHQFLRTQEEVMRLFLGGAAPRPEAQALSAAIQVPAVPPPPTEKLEPRAPSVLPPASPVPPQEAASAPPAVFPLQDRAGLTRRLMSLTSERTGYPVEMLQPTQDLEAELGIDSIKRVEILSMLQKAMPPAVAEQLRARTDALTRARTLDSIVEQVLLSARQVESAAVVRASAPEALSRDNGHLPATPVEGPPLDAQGLLKLLIDLVAQRTGYLPDMLGPDQDLEAEMGIDSIKRVEILDAYQKALSTSYGAVLKTRAEEFARIRTLRGYVEKLQALASAPARAPRPSHNGAEELSTPALRVARNGLEAIEGCPRYVMRATLAELPRTATRGPLQGLFLITDDAGAISQHLAEALRRQGAQVVILDEATCEAPERLEPRLQAIRAEHGPVTGIIHLMPMAATVMPPRLSVWRRQTQLQVKSFFHLLKACGGEALRYVLTASQFGGGFGRTGELKGLPASGGAQGVLKSFHLEQPLVVAKAIDFDETLEAEQIAHRLLDELQLAVSDQEVGYLGGARHVFSASPAPLAVFKMAEQLQPEPGWVVLITGGARGITSEVAQALARPGMKLVLVGRTPEPQEESEETAGLAHAAQLREFLIHKATRAGASRTPVQIESEVLELLRNREIRRNLAKLRQTGAHVEYAAVDVANEQQFGGFIDGIYARHGRLDAVLHGAGVIADKLVADKSRESFERVFDTKADSAFILYRHLRPESLKVVLLFSSTAGRFGNRGQADYAGANEVLNRWAWHLTQEWSSVRIVSINWGPWEGTGMARGAVNQQFQARGIQPITISDGCRFAVEELLVGGREAEVIAGLGPWAQLAR